MKLNTCFLTILLLGGISQSIHATDVKKIAKVVWHGVELYAGIVIGTHCQLKLQWNNCINAVAAGSLAYHGFTGLDKELKLLKTVQEFIG